MGILASEDHAHSIEINSHGFYSRLRRQASDIPRKCREMEVEARCSVPYLEIYFRKVRKCGSVANNIMADKETGCRRNELGNICSEVLNSGLFG